jgi:endo-1,4-beta-xylanase
MKFGVHLVLATVVLLATLAVGYAWMATDQLDAAAATTVQPARTPVQAPVASASAAGPVPVKAPVEAPEGLRTLAATHGLRIGTAVDSNVLKTDPGYARRLATDFSSVTAENAMKWSTVEPVRGQYDFSGADAVVEFARAHNQTVRGHTLVWYKALPPWLENGKFTPAELRAILKNHVETMVRRWSGMVSAWDVVNEPLDSRGRLRNNIWLRTLGPGYIADVFRWARAADPLAKLYLNDYDTESSGRKADGLYSLVSRLKSQGVPINGVGFQMHLRLPTDRAYAPTLQRFADLKLDISVTELDVRTNPSHDQKAQAKVYGRAVAACLSVKRCVSLTVWGFTDAYSWLRDYGGAATMFDATLAPKPAYGTVRKVLADRR